MMTADEIRDGIFYDEEKVPPYTLPDPLLKADGTRVTSAYDWTNRQRPRLYRLLADEMYGHLPPRPDRLEFTLLSEERQALGGHAIRREVRITCGMADGRSHSFDLLLYLPKNADKPVPAFLGLNFQGNHTTTTEPGIREPRQPRQPGQPHQPAGNQTSRWLFEEVIRRGYASATLYYCDIHPDRLDGWSDSIYRLFHDQAQLDDPQRPFSCLSAWSWGLSRALDYLQTVPEIAADKVIVHGHSRLGKTSLWAGASDPRFAMVISNDSGCGGAALFRRCLGETLLHMRDISGVGNIWFCGAAAKYAAREASLPFDQHALIGLMAPRPVYVASATEDLWADPKGEFLAVAEAEPVYRLFGSAGLGTRDFPPPDTPVQADLAYHRRTGKHDITLQDWTAYMNFADRVLR